MKSFTAKIIVLSALVFSGMMLSMMLIIIFSKISGLNVNSENGFLDLAASNQYPYMFRFFIGVNHIFTFIIFPCIFVYIFYKKEINRYFTFSAFNPLLIILFPLALLSLYPLMVFFTQLIENINLPEFFTALDKTSIESLSKILAMHNFTDLIINLIIVGLLPGIGEELLFRGIIQKELSIIWKNYHLAIWVSAFIFSAFHFQIVGFPAKMGIGLVLGYAYYYSGNLFMPMFLHSLNNSIATVSFYFYGTENEVSNSISDKIPIVTVVIATLLFFMIMKNIQSISKINFAVDE